MIKILTGFDFETNGNTKGCSVLEGAFIKITIDVIKKKILSIDKYDRFYYPENEDLNIKALEVHKLSLDVIKEKRSLSDLSYPKYFSEDKESLFSFLKGTDIIIAHNIDYDIMFLPEVKHMPRFCTMKGTKDVIQAKNANGKTKNPTLREFIEYYKIDFDTELAHGALYDTEKMMEGFLAYLKANPMPFMGKNKEILEENSYYISDKALLNQTVLKKQKPLYVKGFSFLICNKYVTHNSKGFKGDSKYLYVYEKLSGNLFFVVPKEEAFSIEKKLTKIIELIGEDNLKTKIDVFTNKNDLHANKSLLDYM